MSEVAYYSIAQIARKPERMEFLNFGIVLFVPSEERPLSLMAAPTTGMLSVFLWPDAIDRIQTARDWLMGRIHELSANGPTLDSLNAFAATRVGDVRLTPFLPVAMPDDAYTLGRQLMQELVE